MRFCDMGLVTMFIGNYDQIQKDTYILERSGIEELMLFEVSTRQFTLNVNLSSKAGNMLQRKKSMLGFHDIFWCLLKVFKIII